MNERIKELAEQAGFRYSGEYHCDEYNLERFAELVRADERSRLHELNQVLVEALKRLIAYENGVDDMFFAKAALIKAGEK